MKRLTLALFVAGIALLAIGLRIDAAPRSGLYDPIDSATLEQAVRLGNEQLANPPAVGLWGQPFAPEGLSNCDEMTFYRQQWGLPSAFDGIGWRESNCRNEDAVKTFCCHGYWQMYTSLHLKSTVLRPKMHACGVTSHHDLNSDVPIEKQRQACAAKALYDEVGTSPWSATR